MEQFIYYFNLIGIIAFSISGSLVAIKKSMDLLGVIILGVVTAVGGGIIRDLLLGHIPPAMFQDPFGFGIAVLSALVVFLFLYQRMKYSHTVNQKRFFENLLLLSDSIGLGVFTVSGVQKAMDANGSCGIILAVTLGVITGVGGGIIRDLFAGEIPTIFRKHVYASASIIGGLVCTFMWNRVGKRGAIIAGFIIVLSIRLLAAHFKWNLPKIYFVEKGEKKQ